MNTRQEYINQLRIREAQLVEDLSAIRKLLASEGAIEVNDNNHKSKDSKVIVKAEGTPKGKYGWEDYAQVILKTIGGRVKSQAVIEYAVKANPKINEQRITDAIRGKLSKLAQAGIIGVEKGASKTEGYDYFIKEEKPKTLNLNSLLKQA